MDIAGGLALTALVLTFVAVIVGAIGHDARFTYRDTKRRFYLAAAILGGLSAVGYIAAIWTAVLS